jgi:hypothetical protein
MRIAAKHAAVGYIPLGRQAANLLFALVSRRCERGSIIITSNRGFETWGEILGDAMVAAAPSPGSCTRPAGHAQRQELPVTLTRDRVPPPPPGHRRSKLTPATAAQCLHPAQGGVP